MDRYRLDIRQTPDGLRCDLTFGYGEKLPREPERKKAVIAMLKDALDQIEQRGLVSIGQSDNDRQRIRRDMWQVGDGGAK